MNIVRFGLSSKDINRARSSIRTFYLCSNSDQEKKNSKLGSSRLMWVRVKGLSVICYILILEYYYLSLI